MAKSRPIKEILGMDVHQIQNEFANYDSVVEDNDRLQAALDAAVLSRESLATDYTNLKVTADQLAEAHKAAVKEGDELKSRIAAMEAHPDVIAARKKAAAARLAALNQEAAELHKQLQ